MLGKRIRAIAGRSAFRSVRAAVLVTVLLGFFEKGQSAEPPGLVNTALVENGGNAGLRVEPSVVARGETFKITSELRFGSNPTDLYNPFLWEGYKLPAQIVIVSADGSIRYEVLRSRVGLLPPAAPNQWLSLPSMPTVGCEFAIKVGAELSDNSGRVGVFRAIDLPPGEYFVQAVYNRWLYADRPRVGPNVVRISDSDAPQLSPRSTRADMENTIGASKAVKLTVTPEAVRSERQARSEDNSEPSQKIVLELTPRKLQSKPGREVSLDITVVNRLNAVAGIWNPFLNPLISERAMSLMVTAEDVDIGNLLIVPDGSRISAGPGQWVMLPPGGRVSTSFTFRAGEVPRTPFTLGRFLPPGKYILQLRGYSSLISPPPFVSNEQPAALADLAIPRHVWFDAFWLDAPPGPEIYRSNRVELEILPRTGD